MPDVTEFSNTSLSTTTRMPSVTKRKQIPSLEPAQSPKRGRFDTTNSPVSSPIKGPLREHTETNSPSFVAKCFYGIKKSNQSPVSTKQKTPVKKATTSVATSKNGSKKQSEHKGDSLAGRVEQLMSEMIAASPVKQRLFESCSRAEFRKLYSDEYKQIEELVARESQRVTRRTSKIVLTRSDESDTDDYNSSDEEAIFHVDNHGLDNESDDENFEHIKILKRPPAIKDQKISAENLSLDDLDEENTPAIEDDQSNVLTPKSTMEIDSKILTPSSSGRKFFKTRTPVDNSKMYGIVCGKGFNLRVVPKTLQALFDKKAKKAQQKKKSPQSPAQKKIETPKSQRTAKSLHNGSFLSNGDSPCSADVSSPQGEFWFAPGFLSPETSGDAELPTNANLDSVDGLHDADLSVNKNSQVTYQKTPPKKKIIADDDFNPQTGSHPNSARSSSDSVDLLPSQEPVCVGGSEDLFSSQTVSPADEDRESRDQGKSNQGSTESFITSEGEKVIHSTQINGERPAGTSDQKLFPIFTRRSSRLASPAYPKKSPTAKTVIASPKDPNQAQMILDAGQKKFGATQCSVCGMVYCHADPEDEAAHSKFHRRLLNALKYPKWKSARVIQEYPEELGKMILVLAEDAKYIKKKVEEVNQIMARELGFPDNPSTYTTRQQKVFLYVVEDEIAGCCVAEPVKEGYRIIPGDMDTSVASGQRPWRCSDVPEEACVGISRLWVAAGKRRGGVATKLVDCVRQWFDYGTLTPLHLLAFSDPTPDGRMFAQKYMNSTTFLVYKYNPNH
ncbi:N-acetyltransferase esco1 [Plakobranchus ocellatus]|uniref:N-acetyltransferase esco1 n=1 Tax=Plakobranchus ocellatus TaxID=259542 RepID=A0AAV4DJK7_9GAST|nr:N-acetyltransferase esco1 [Plakobranchus ocellatus]